MAYISTSHSVGDIVFAYDDDNDSIQRLRIIGVQASSESVTRYGTGEWHVEYLARPAQAAGPNLTRSYCGDDLHSAPRSAFPDIAPEAAPATVEEVQA